MLPALSVQVPDTDPAEVSGPSYAGEPQASMPDVVSAPLKATSTGRLYQPASFGDRSGTAPVAPGAVSSYFSPKSREALRLPARSVHVPDSDAVELSGPS